MHNQTRHKQRAAVGVFLTAVGFVTAHLATAKPYGALALLMAICIFVVGLILLETALFRALDDAFVDDAAPELPTWTRAMAAK